MMNMQTKAFVALIEKAGWVKTNIRTKRNDKYSEAVYVYKNKIIVVLEDSYCLEKKVNHVVKSAGTFNINEKYPYDVQLLLNSFLEIL